MNFRSIFILSMNIFSFQVSEFALCFAEVGYFWNFTHTCEYVENVLVLAQIFEKEKAVVHQLTFFYLWCWPFAIFLIWVDFKIRVSTKNTVCGSGTENRK